MQGENPYHISGSRTDAESAICEAERWLKPLPQIDLKRELVALHLKTKSAKSGETDVELLLEIYLSELRAFPGDVVRDVLRGWSGVFFPAWAELKEEIIQDRRIRERRLRIVALREFLRGSAEETAKGPRPTDEQIERNSRYFKTNDAPVDLNLDEAKIEALKKIDQMPQQIAHRKNTSNWVSTDVLAKKIGSRVNY